MRRFSLITQLAAALIVITSVVSVVFLLQRYFYVKQEISQSLDFRIQQTLKRIQVSAAIPAYQVDIEIVEDTIRSEMQQQEIQGIFITEKESEKPNYGFLKIESGQIISTKDLPSDKELIMATTQLEAHGKSFANVDIFVTPRYLQQQLRQQLTRVTIETMILICLQVLVAAFVLRYLFVKPIQQLTALSKEIADGHTNSQPFHAGSTELSTLSHSLYHMRNAIHQSLAKLADKNEQLQAEVQERLQAENALRESREYLHITLNSLSEGVIATDRNGSIQNLNSVAEQLTGFTLAESIQLPLSQVLSFQGDNCPDIRRLINNIIADGKATSLIQTVALQSKDDILYQITLNGSPIFDKQNNVVGCVVVIRDVTEQQKLEDQLRQSRKMDSIGQLAGGIAHDFNNMLTGIMGAASLLQLDNTITVQQQKNIDLIIQSSQRAADLTNQLLAFARKSAAIKENVDIHLIINDAIAILKRSIDKNITIQNVTTAEKHLIWGDKSQLQSVLINLGVNSQDAMPHGGDLIIKTSNCILDELFCNQSYFELEPGNYLKIDVRDTGEGIAKEHLEKVFEPFFTTKKIGKGTGLGLAAVYGTVRDHRGMVHVYSELGQGTQFTIYLPLNATEEENSSANQQGTDICHGTGTILVIDDEDILRTVLQDALELLGYEVLIASNGVEGISIFQKNQTIIDLVILDMIMPEMGGKETFDQLTLLNPEVPVLFTSGFSKEEKVDEIASLGAGFIQKPYVLPSLSQAVADLIGRTKPHK